MVDTARPPWKCLSMAVPRDFPRSGREQLTELGVQPRAIFLGGDRLGYVPAQSRHCAYERRRVAREVVQDAQGSHAVEHIESRRDRPV